MFVHVKHVRNEKKNKKHSTQKMQNNIVKR